MENLDVLYLCLPLWIPLDSLVSFPKGRSQIVLICWRSSFWDGLGSSHHPLLCRLQTRLWWSLWGCFHLNKEKSEDSAWHTLSITTWIISHHSVMFDSLYENTDYRCFAECFINWQRAVTKITKMTTFSIGEKIIIDFYTV